MINISYGFSVKMQLCFYVFWKQIRVQEANIP